MYPTIVVYNESKLVLDDEAAAVCAAIQRQLTEHFEPVWGCSAVMHFAKAGEPADAGAWVFKLVDKIDVSGALGYHSDDGRKPYALIDVSACIADNVTWSSCLSHEVLEAVADPECVRCFDVGGKVLALEVSDPVEASKKIDGTDYEIDGVVLENFVTPDWFVPGSSGPWDYLGILAGPLDRTAGGYDQYASVGAWRQESGARTRNTKRTARPGSRRAQRGVTT